MGVDVPFDDLRPTEYVGFTFERHCELVTAIEDQVVAIDASQWVFQAYQGARSREAQGGLKFTDAIRLSAITLIMDRVTQILRYGAHPVVVIDGRPPREKAYAAHWTGHGPHQIHDLVIQLCKAMGVSCVRAPGEGEAFCAALNECGVADLCFTSDVIDVFFFGACKVMRSIGKGEQTKAKFLTYHDPPGSSFAVVTSNHMIVYVDDMVKKEHLKDVLLFYAAVIGTDYNVKGLPNFGKEKARAMTRLIYNHWQELHESGYHENGFLDFAVSVVSGTVDISTSDKSFKTFLKSCADVTFATDLKQVATVVQDQRAKAREQAQQFQRADVMWTGEHLQHSALMSFLVDANVDQEQENGVNGVLNRVMKVEAERMLRFGESSTCRPLIRIESISKPKEVKKWANEQGQDATSSVRFYQYLVNVATDSDCDIEDDEAKAQLIDYVKRETTWRASARAARASAIKKKWPSVLNAYHEKCAAKVRKPARVPKSSQDGGSKGAKTKASEAVKSSAGSVRNMRTVQGTRDICSFLVSDKAPSQRTLDMIAAHQPRGGSCTKQQQEAKADVSPVLRERKTGDGVMDGPGQGPKLNRQSKGACSAGAAASNARERQTPLQAVHDSNGRQINAQRSSQRSQCTNLFADMPDVIAKQPNVFFAGTSASDSPTQGQRQCSPPVSPEKRDRTCVPEDTADTSLDADRALPSNEAIDLTLSSDDDLPCGRGQCSHGVGLLASSEHATPKKRRSYGRSASPTLLVL